MIVKSILDDYFDWLLEQVDFFLPEHRDYLEVIKSLHATTFKWVVPMDENRDIDGYELRKEYLFDNGYSTHDIWDTPRSCLEVLVAFSRRIEIEITGEPGNDDLSHWFWVMVENLGLLKYDDDHFRKDEVDKILGKWLCRKFSKKGHGSVFFVTKSDIDMRKVEMWYQMHHYLNENWKF